MTTGGCLRLRMLSAPNDARKVGPSMQLPPPPANRGSSIGRSATRWASSHKFLSGVVGVLLIATSVNALASDSTVAPEPQAEQPSPSETGSPEPSIAPEPVIPKTKVPRMTGLSLQQAKQRATARSLDVFVIRKYSAEPAGTVLHQSIRVGGRVDEGTSIELFVAKPFPRVPGVAGQGVRVRKASFEPPGSP